VATGLVAQPAGQQTLGSIALNRLPLPLPQTSPFGQSLFAEQGVRPEQKRPHGAPSRPQPISTGENWHSGFQHTRMFAGKPKCPPLFTPHT
jgi:hypothetical protein